MKILVIYQNYRNSYTGLANSFIREFKQLSGFEYCDFQIKPISFIHNYNRILNKIPFLSTLHFAIQNIKLLIKCHQTNPYAIIVLKGTDLSPIILKLIKKRKKNIITACFNPDDPFNRKSCKKNIVDSIKYYNHYFIWTQQLIEKIKDAGAQNVHYLPFATDNEIIYPVHINKYLYDMTFIGNGDEERQSWIESIADEIERRDVNISFHVFGHNWRPYKNIFVHLQVNGIKMLECIAQSKININILRKQNKNSTNMRTFEIPAAGGFMFHEHSKEATEIFKENVEAVYFSTTEELVTKAISFLNDINLIKTIAANGYKTATNNKNTYQHRSLSIINTITHL
jgi:spore maturation protein CgeB